jgi:hypothetical protein
MTINIAQLKNAEPSLDKLIKTELPIQVSFRLSKLIKIIGSELAHFETTRQKLFEKYGEQQDNGVVIKAEFMAEFMEQINALLNETIELPDIKVSITEISDIKFSAMDLVALEPWITE